MAEEGVVLDFAASSIASVWALELLLTLRRPPRRAWRGEDLIKQMRASQHAVSDALMRLQSSRLVIEEGGLYRYEAASAELDELVGELEHLYAAKPVAVISAIAHAPNRKLQILSDAFRLKKGK